MKAAFPTTLPLALKLSVMISLLIISGVSIMSVTSLNKQGELQDQQINDFSHAMAKQLASSITEPLFTDDMLSLQLMINNFAELPRVIGATVIDKKGSLLAHTDQAINNISTIKRLTDQLNKETHTISLIEQHGVTQAASRIEFQNKVGGYVFILLKTDLLSDTYANTLKLILVVSLIVTLAGLLAAYYISRHISHPIEQILEATTRISGGEFNHIEERRNDELGRLISTINQMGDGLLRKQQVETLLDSFLDKDVADQVLKQLDTVEVRGERVNATVLFADIVGFTSMSEDLSPEKVADLLNEYFTYFTMCAQMYFGTIDKFIGDCAMVVFGTPKKDTDHKFHAIACAILMHKLIQNLNIERQQQGLSEIELRIGINSGPMLAGVLGNKKRMEYTVVGDSVNLASRLCSEAAPGQILTTEHACFDAMQQQKIKAHSHKSIRVRGKENSVNTYIVEDIGREYQLTMDSLIEDVLNRRATSNQDA